MAAHFDHAQLFPARASIKANQPRGGSTTHMVGRVMAIIDEARALAERVRECAAAGYFDDELRITLTRDVSPKLFVLKNGAIRVSKWHADGLAGYAGISQADFIAICALLGLTQRTALEQNGEFIEEDCWHIQPMHCLYTFKERKQDYASTIDELQVCDGCLEFYSQLGAVREIYALEYLLIALQNERAR